MKRKGESGQAQELYLRAFELEAEAAELVDKIIDQPNEPTRSILYRSAASLALDAGKLHAAERLIAEALRGQPPTDIAEELHHLLEQVNLELHP